MQAHEQTGTIGIGSVGALLERHVQVGVPEEDDGNTLFFQCGSKAACPNERKVFLDQISGQDSAAIIAPMAGIDNDHETRTRRLLT